MNAWTLKKDLEPFLTSKDEAVAAAAKLVFESYLYPVDSLVLSPEGELLDHVCANDLFAGPEKRYLELLDAASR